MPYDPNALSEKQRSNAYFNIWIGLVASIVMVLSNVFAFGAKPEGFAALIVGLHLLIYAIYNRFDEHFRSLVAVGFAWSVSVVGLWLSAQGLLMILEAGYGLGRTAAGAPAMPGDFSYRLPDWFNRAYLLAALASLAFHLGFLKAHRWGS